MRFCVVGLGYVGLTMAVHLVRKGFYVEGVDVSNTVIAALSEGRAHFYEENFDEEVRKAIQSGRFRFGKVITPYDGKSVFIVTVGTPLGSDGRVHLEPIKAVANAIAAVIRNGDVVMLRSTVRVGVTRNIVKPLLDASGNSYFLGFCPERTIEGKALQELDNLPQIISGLDPESKTEINAIFSEISRETVVMDSLEEAEMVKLLNNAERDLMFALANEIALMCDAKGLNAHKVISAANYHYPRSNLRRPGPVGGPCLEKDPYILTESFLGERYVPKLFRVGREINERIMSDTFEAFANIYVTRMGRDPQKIAILGMAFKGVPPTGDMRGSLVYKLVDAIRDHFPYADLVGHDYLASARDIEGARCRPQSDIRSALENADMVILQNNHPAYAKEPWRDLLPVGALVLDFWNQLEDGIIDGGRYYRFGALKAGGSEA